MSWSGPRRLPGKGLELSLEGQTKIRGGGGKEVWTSLVGRLGHGKPEGLLRGAEQEKLASSHPHF